MVMTKKKKTKNKKQALWEYPAFVKFQVHFRVFRQFNFFKKGGGFNFIQQQYLRIFKSNFYPQKYFKRIRRRSRSRRKMKRRKRGRRRVRGGGRAGGGGGGEEEEEEEEEEE